MKNHWRKLTFFVACFSVGTPTFGMFLPMYGMVFLEKQRIIPSKSLIDLYEQLQKVPKENRQETLVVFDLDYTLFWPDAMDHTGGDIWRNIVTEHIKKHYGLTHEIAHYAANEMGMKVTHGTPLRPLEGEITKKVLANIQALGFCVMILTARLPQDSDGTLNQLGVIGFNFLESAPSFQSFDLDYQTSQIPFYEDGVLFCGSNDKGQVLMNFLNRINMQTEKIFFVDDRKSYVESVGISCCQHKIPFEGFHYTYAENETRKVFEEKQKKDPFWLEKTIDLRVIKKYLPGVPAQQDDPQANASIFLCPCV